MRVHIRNQEGQVALVALTVTAILTVLSTLLIQRSVLEQRLSRQGEESARTLNLAEAGVEELLADIENITAGTGQTLAGIGEYSKYDESSVSKETVRVGRTRDLVVKDAVYNGDASFDFKWDYSGVGSSGVLMTVLGGNEVKRFLFANCPLGTCPNNITSANATLVSVGTSTTINLAAAPYGLGVVEELVRFKALWNDVELTVGGNLPTQSYRIEVASAEGDAGTNVQATQSIPQLPSIFDYALFSGTEIVKN